MKSIRPFFFLSVAILSAPEAYAQDGCPGELKWTDATYAQRTITENGLVVEAKTEAFVDASVVHISVNGVRSGVIRLFSKDRANSIQLTFGSDKPNPLEFSEIPMLVEPPMTDGTWPRMMGPCSIPEGVSVNFDERDIPASTANEYPELPKFSGTLQRAGLSVKYSMVVDGGETWKGEVRFSRELKLFDLQVDVQGWHIFRANSYVESLPMGRPVSVRSIIERIGLRTQTK